MLKPEAFHEILSFIEEQSALPAFAADPTAFFAGAMTSVLYVAATKGVDPFLLLAAGVDGMREKVDDIARLKAEHELSKSSA